MGRKRKRPQKQQKVKEEFKPFVPRRKRSEFKRARVREMLEKGLTKKDMDRRRDRYHCMTGHPGRYCTYCNPRQWEEAEDEGDDDIDWSEEEAELSHSWSDGEDWDFDGISDTYSEAWDEEADKIHATKFLKHGVALVDATAIRLEAAMDPANGRNPLAGNLAGNWDILNEQLSPKSTKTWVRNFTLRVQKLPPGWRPIPSRFLCDLYRPMDICILLQMKDKEFVALPFQLPVNASPKPIPIILEEYPPQSFFGSNRSYRICAEIAFLGKGYLHLRVPRCLAQARGEATKNGSELVQFAGIRRSKTKMKLPNTMT